MTFSGGQLETEMVSQSQERAEIVGGHAFRRKSERVIDVDQRGVFPTVTVSDAATGVSPIV